LSFLSRAVTFRGWLQVGAGVDTTIKVHLDYDATFPCIVLMEIAAHDGGGQRVQSAQLVQSPEVNSRDVPGDGGIGTRSWLNVTTKLGVTYLAQVSVTRPRPNWQRLQTTPLPDLPPEVVTYLMSSRYCPADAFGDFLPQTFGSLTGGALIAQMAEWIGKNLTYDIGASTQQTTALDTFASRRGVCRDYAHLMVAFARCNAIPARMVSVYGPDVTPQDFHAVAEVWLDGGWHMIDPTGMATADRLVKIAVGRDAADVAFLTAFGQIQTRHQRVEVAET